MFVNVFNNLRSQLTSMLYIAPVMLLAITVHECAHGWVSDKLGDPTPRNSGRLSLNPFKHLDLMGTLCLLLFRVGWATPVPINPFYYKDRKKGIIYVSIAGPAANFVLAFISLLLDGILLRFGRPNSMFIWILSQLLYYSAVINVGLGLFNLVPIPPLDGSKVVGELSPKAAEFYWKYQRYWRIVLLVCVVTGLLSRPLGMLNNAIISGMWSLVRWIV